MQHTKQTNSNIRIERFDSKFQNQVNDLILGIQVNEFAIPITLEDQPDLLGIPSFYQKGTGNFWVALDHERVVGTIALVDIGNDQTALRKMFVADSHRGKEKGVAQALLEQAISWCKEKGISHIFLGTTAKYLAAHRFYEKNGFCEISKVLLPASFPVMNVDTKFYAYELSER